MDEWMGCEALVDNLVDELGICLGGLMNGRVNE